MNTSTANLANSSLVLWLCLIPIIIVAVQAVIFLVRAWKEADNLGISVQIRKKVVRNSAVFSLVPSLPIILIMAVLMPTLGKYIPWLRLSVIGSAMYENLAADLTVKSFGLFGVADSSMTPSIFISVVWVMTLGVMMYPLANIFVLKRYDSGVKRAVNKGGFIAKAIPAMFVGVMAFMSVPNLVNFSNPAAITTVITAAVAIYIIDALVKKYSLNWLKEFSFPMSMLIGMISAIPFSRLFAAF